MVTIRPLDPADWAAVELILASAITSGEASFETSTPSWEEFARTRIDGLRLVAVDQGVIVGWSAASHASSRAVLRGVVDHGIYLHESHRGRGIGNALLGELVAAAERHGVWMMQSQVFRENAASLALHARHGFRVVGHRERIARSTLGAHAGQWRDALLIERRSAVNGRD